MSTSPKVMISSTARDLPAYRDQVKDACLRADFFPKMMEQLPALDADAIKASLDMVEEAEVYIGIFAHRYGYIPKDHDISITQMEYERAVERDLPRLIFLMGEDVPVLPKDVDKGKSGEKLDALKKELQTNRVVAYFKNPEDLRGLVLHSLQELQKQRSKEEATPEGQRYVDRLHHFAPIPEKPVAYIAHPYTLLQLRGLIGRKRELEMLTDWVTKPQLQHLTIFNVVAIGGMGKSALTWTWFNNIAPQEMKLAGRVWWSFYESDATFENFVTRTLAYVTNTSIESLKKFSAVQQQNALLHALDQEPHLIVLDGLERIMIAYTRHDAAYLNDDSALDDETANRVAGAYGLPQSAGQSFVGRHKLRKTADVKAGQFLRKLTKVRRSKILVSTRLYPSELQLPNGSPIAGCNAVFLPGLSDQDALDLWRAYGAKGSRESMLPVFRTFDKHPLLLQLLAYEVAEFRGAPGDFDAWQRANPDFDPFGLPLVQVQSHVLAFALEGLSPAELQTLHVIAGFRMPASMETVKALLIPAEEKKRSPKMPFKNLGELDKALAILEDRGLLGWDRQANRYDLHPIVRGVVWGGVKEEDRTTIKSAMKVHFEAMPMIEDFMKVESLSDLSYAIELYNTLIDLGLFQRAYEVFRDHLNNATLYRLSASRLRIELLEKLFINGLNNPPPLESNRAKSLILNAIAQGFLLSGQLQKATPLYEMSLKLDIKEDDQVNIATDYQNMSHHYSELGSHYNAELCSRKSLQIVKDIKDIKDTFKESMSFYCLGITNLLNESSTYNTKKVFLRGINMAQKTQHYQSQGLFILQLAKLMTTHYNLKKALLFANHGEKIAKLRRYQRDIIEAANIQGVIELKLKNYEPAKEKLLFALNQAQTVQLVVEELPALINLAQLHYQQNAPQKAREYLEDVWELAERGPYPLHQADALNVFARIEIAEGNTAAAIVAATEAYQKAWCDGPPYAYHSGLEDAKALLTQLNAPFPEMPPFDAANFEPMPEVDLNPKDEFWVDEDRVDELIDELLAELDQQ